MKGQSILHEEKLKRDPEKAKRHLLYVQSSVVKCTKHGGAFISVGHKT